MHLSCRVVPGVPTLRRPAVLDVVRRLVRALPQRGVRVVSYTVMGNHVHLVVTAASREAMGDAMRYFFGLAARRINAVLGRSGRLWSERYACRCLRNARQAWHALNYALRNAAAAGVPVPRGGWDRYTGVDPGAIEQTRFLRSVFGFGRPLRALLLDMGCIKRPFRPLAQRLQLALF